MEGRDGEPGPHVDDAHAPELPGLSPACDMLAEGEAVVVPNPAPMAYGVVSTSARAMNALKQRSPDQNVAVSLHDAARRTQVESVVDLSGTARDAVVALLRRRLTVLVPLRRRVALPRWTAPAVRDEYLAVFDGFWAPTARLWERFPRLYGSSANITGQPPADSAEQAAAMFGGACIVIDGESVTGPPGPRWASTMVRIDGAGRLALHRSGADDATSGLSVAAYLRQLALAVGLPDQGRDDGTGRSDGIEMKEKRAMSGPSFTTTVRIGRPPDEVFDAIIDPRAWWSTTVDGDAGREGAEFVFDSPGHHLWKLTVVEAARPTRARWRVTSDSSTDFVADRTEWNGTEVRFEITPDEGSTSLSFTHAGLVPQFECFEACSAGWTGYIQRSLRDLITTGRGQPGRY